MTDSPPKQTSMYYVTWDDGREGRIRTQFPRQEKIALQCAVGLRRHGAEDVKIVPRREDDCTIPVWKAGDPGFYYFASGTIN